MNQNNELPTEATSFNSMSRCSCPTCSGLGAALGAPEQTAVVAAADFIIPDNPDYDTDLYRQEGADQLLREHYEPYVFSSSESIYDQSYSYSKQWQTDPESGLTFVDPTPYDGSPNENTTVLSYAGRSEGNDVPDADSEEAYYGVLNIPWSQDASWSQTLEWSLQVWSDVANIEFVETEYNPDTDIVFQHYAESDPDDAGAGGSGFAYVPGIWVYDGETTDVTTQSSVNMNLMREPNVEDDRINGWRNTVLVHEIGHALSLPHPGDYNLTELVEQGIPVLHQFIAASRQDTDQYSIMGYAGGQYSGADFGGGWVNPFSYNARGETNQVSTPQLSDIIAIQQLYGANTETRAGDTVYGFNSTAERDHLDFAFLESDGSKPVLTIYDAGGEDTLDLSGYDDANLVNLYDGNFSNVAGLTGNVAIAYDTVIENAVGGGNDDIMLGNDSANHLAGGNGADLMMGQAGGDSLAGGAGDDIIYGDGYRFTGDDLAALQTAMDEGISAGSPTEVWQDLVDSNPVIADIWDRQRKIAFSDLAASYLAESGDVGYAELIGAQYRSPEDALADSSSREDVLVDSMEHRNELIASLEEDWSNTQITFLQEQDVLINNLTGAGVAVASIEAGDAMSSGSVMLASAEIGSLPNNYDIALYQGNQDEYTLSTDAETGVTTVADSVEGRDGTDQLFDVEEIMFADTTISTDSIAKQLEAFASASGSSDGGLGSGGLLDNDQPRLDQRDMGVLAA